MTFAEEKKGRLQNFIHSIVVIAATEIYMTLGCLPVVATKSYRAYWFIAKLKTP